MIQLKEIFNVTYGNKFDLNKMNQDLADVHFVGRSGSNNGVTAKVGMIESVKPNEPGLITVALGGSVLSSFVQLNKFYTGQNIAVLRPKSEMTLALKLFYCKAIQSNAFRFSTCGREANRTLKTLLVPSIDEAPSWIEEVELNCIKNLIRSLQNLKTL